LRKDGALEPLVKIIEDKCTSCYACVRKCPVKAIRLNANDNMPKLLPNRCIGCGICIQSCSYNAIWYRDSKPKATDLLAAKTKPVAIVDPSIAAEFGDITDYRKFVQMIKALGFREVTEVAFGVDLIARKYYQLFGDFKGRYYITSNDPVIVSYIEKYHPNLIQNLAPIVSPKIATAKVAHALYGPDTKVVYIGPNIAAKEEILRYQDDGKIDAALTFVELRELFEQNNIDESNLEFSEFSGPRGYKGNLYPLTNGLMQAAEIQENILTSNVLSVDGHMESFAAIEEFEENIESIQKHFNVSFGNQLTGPGTTAWDKILNRQSLVIQFASKRMQNFYRYEWEKEMRQFDVLNLACKFTQDDQRLPAPSPEKVAQILDTMKVREGVSQRGCASCGYSSCHAFAIAVAQGLTSPDMCITYSQRNQRDYINALKASNEKLANTQKALEQSEKKSQKEKQIAQEASEIITSMLHKLRAGVLILDEHLKVVHCNQTFIDMLGEDAREINEVIPGLKGADVKTLLPYNFYNLFNYVLTSSEDIPNRDVQFNEKLLNISIFNIKPNAIVGAVVRDLHVPVVQREEVIHRVTEVIDKNLEMVQKIGFLLGEGASETERMLNSIIESFKTGGDKK
jgi:iron only hydrogenase large subunit-like protein